MRKHLKKKNRSCAMCKPWKRGWSNRWKPKVFQFLKQSDRELQQYSTLNREVE